jgi:pimeloyl-ACP methyl ester carboxylesterase
MTPGSLTDVSLRLRWRGGEVRPAAKVTRLAGLPYPSRILLLIHGYNVSQCSACHAYTGFIENFTSWPASIWWPVYRCFWPGDGETGTFLDYAAYPWKIGTARECADRLHDLLKKVRGPAGRAVEVSIVGHSLGCRVVMELLERLRTAATGARGEVRLGLVCLMAAAVPVELVRVDRPLNPRSQRLRDLLVLFSPNDEALGFKFVAGQLAARLLKIETASFREAVGLRGEPPGFSTAKHWLHGESGRGRGAGHSDYWPSREAAEHVACHLGSTALYRLRCRQLEGRELLARELPPARRMEPRTLDDMCEGC